MESCLLAGCDDGRHDLFSLFFFEIVKLLTILTDRKKEITETKKRTKEEGKKGGKKKIWKVIFLYLYSVKNLHILLLCYIAMPSIPNK